MKTTIVSMLFVAAALAVIALRMTHVISDSLAGVLALAVIVGATAVGITRSHKRQHNA